MSTKLLSLALFALAACALATEQPKGRIIGGSTVDIARHPYIVSLRYRRNTVDDGQGYLHECAGIIYSERAVVTAAQCMWNLPTGTKVMAVAGAKTRNSTDGMLYPISKWSYHPQFNYYTADYDIAVLLLESPFDLTRFEIRSIGLREVRPAAGRIAIVAGWGYREEGGPNSHQLEQTHVPIVSQEQCNSIYGAGEVTDRMICAGDLQQGGRDACQGDTGGPLVVDEQLVGLVSWGRGCGRVGYPTVYTYVASLKQWIDETLAAANAL